jgi:UPF0716 protein FxsA
MRLSWIFLVIFIIEVWLLITWGADIGIVMTLLEFIVSAIIGWNFIRLEGFKLLTQMRYDVQQGNAPQIDAMPNLLNIIGSVMLIVPGFFTDILACVLFIPWIKGKLLQKIWLGLQKNAKKNSQRHSIIIDQKDE